MKGWTPFLFHPEIPNKFPHFHVLTFYNFFLHLSCLQVTGSLQKHLLKSGYIFFKTEDTIRFPLVRGREAGDRGETKPKPVRQTEKRILLYNWNKATCHRPLTTQQMLTCRVCSTASGNGCMVDTLSIKLLCPHQPFCFQDPILSSPTHPD